MEPLLAATGGDIRFKEVDHTWLKRVLGRKVPVTKEGKEAGFSERTVAEFLWGLNEYPIRKLLRCLTEEEEKDEKKDLGDGPVPAEGGSGQDGTVMEPVPAR